MITAFKGRTGLRYGAGGVLTGAFLSLVAVMAGWGGAWLTAIGLLATSVALGIGAYLVGQRLDDLLQQNDAFSRAKQRFTSLTKSAISEDDWQVPLHDAHVPTCWEVKGCQSSECPAFEKYHIRCWLLAGTFCRGEIQGTFAQKLGDCTRCEVYQAAVGRGPIDEIAEDFNSLMWTVKEKEEILARTNEQLMIKYRELDELQKKTQEMAFTDILTGLPNYSHFLKTIKREIGRARRYGRTLSLIAVDLDNFKQVNDRYGYRKGDQVLQALSKLLSDEVRETDYVARYGSEKFVIVMPETAAAGAMQFAERLGARSHRVAEDADLPADHVRIDIGISDFPDCATNMDGLLSAADSALLFAKRSHNRMAYFCDLSMMELKTGDLAKLESRLEGAGLHTIRALADAVDAVDLYPGVHRATLVQVAGDMAARLGLDTRQTDSLALATCLHDIGKIGVPSEILQKQEKLTAAERGLMQRHPEIGVQLLREVKQIENLVTAILYHHERWDGTGYPEGLRGEQIPLAARVIGILDVYRALRSDRPYRRAMSLRQALEEMRRGAGTQFDPELLDMFTEIVQREAEPEEEIRCAG